MVKKLDASLQLILSVHMEAQRGLFAKGISSHYLVDPIGIEVSSILLIVDSLFLFFVSKAPPTGA